MTFVNQAIQFVKGINTASILPIFIDTLFDSLYNPTEAEALTRLLGEKGIFTKEDFLEMVKVGG